MNLRNKMINPLALLQNKDLLPSIKHWFHYRIAKKYSFIPQPSPPPILTKRKINDKQINAIVYQQLKNALKDKTSLMFGRYGSTELQAMRSVLLAKLKIQDYIDFAYDELCIYSGFFQHQTKNPTHQEKFDLLERFSEIMIKATRNCDLFGTWNGALGLEEYFIEHYAKPDALLTQLGFFSPAVLEEIPYTYALKDTKVLVIHPFAKTIQSQYQYHDKLFKNPKVLPSFDLQTFKAVQTLHKEKDMRFKDWFEALDYMSFEISKLDFDIAMIGCGAYGFPLASRIKNMGKIAIHCGGATQLFFGIKGKRWEIEQSCVGKLLFNPYWVYPDSSEIIQDSSKIEGGCYW